jgi:hypothetical protein
MILFALPAEGNSMSTVYEIRRANLIRLTQEPGSKQALALKLNMTPAQVSHWLRIPGRYGARRLHEDHARQIENVLGLSPGELDTPPDTELLAQTTRAVFEEARDRNLGDPVKLGNVVQLAYERARHVGRIDREHIRSLFNLSR